MTMIDVKKCAIDRSRVVVVHIRTFKLLKKTLYGSCFRLARKPGPINSERRKYYAPQQGAAPAAPASSCCCMDIPQQETEMDINLLTLR